MLSPFLSWCTSQGVISPLQLCGDNSCYRYMKCGDGSDLTGTILKVPLNSCIIADTPEVLAERLAHEQSLGQGSKYAPYINILPTLEGSLNSMPRFWDSARLEMVTDGGQIEKKMMMDKREGLDPWAHACVTSRSNYLLGHGFSMTPLLDMINHDSSVGTSATISEDELFLSIDCTFSTGNEVFISYGDLTNLDTLCNYGFVSSTNQFNAESFEVRVIRRPALTVTVSSNGSIDDNAIIMLRSYLINPGELDSSDPMVFSKPVSDQNEMEVYSLLASFLEDAITEAKIGAQNAQDDDLVCRYLTARSEVLSKGLSTVKEKYPLLEF